MSEPPADPTGQPAGWPQDEELIMFLERDQLVSDRARPVPRAELGRATSVALWGLRIFVIVVSCMVIYTFVAQLH